MTGEPGGEVLTKEDATQRQTRADMCETAMAISFQHGSRIVDALLDRFDVQRRKA
jgi:hypothetical protein